MLIPLSVRRFAALVSSCLFAGAVVVGAEPSDGSPQVTWSSGLADGGQVLLEGREA